MRTVVVKERKAIEGEQRVIDGEDTTEKQVRVWQELASMYFWLARNADGGGDGESLVGR